MIPEDEEYLLLKNLISKLSIRYSSPDFEPHVTLVGGIKDDKDFIINEVEKLSKEIESFEIKLKGLDYKDELKRCLFFNTEPSKEYEEVIQIAIKFFEGNYNPKYMRHLSIMYGDFLEDVKKGIIESIERKEYNLKIKKLVLHSSTEEFGKWEKIKEFPLK